LYIDFAMEINQEFIPKNSDLELLDMEVGPRLLMAEIARQRFGVKSLWY